jgi:pimeloyl-ACP methyl ester carboxylesterase
VAHQGTDPTSLLSLLVDGRVKKRSLDPTLFPSVPSSVLVHSGFAKAHARTASSVLSEVKKVMDVTRTRSVTTVGHSLGGALAALDAVFLALNLPSGSEVRGVTYGTPRVGNAAFAELLDSIVPDFIRINNRKGNIYMPSESANLFICRPDPHRPCSVLRLSAPFRRNPYR